MIRHVYDRATEADGVAEVVVATDDARIVEAVEGFGGRAILTDPDHASGTDRVAEALRALETGGARYDCVVNLQGDEPFLDPGAITEVAARVAELATGGRAPMATLARALEDGEMDDPSVVKVVTDVDGYALVFTRAAVGRAREAGAESPARAHLGIYAYTPSFLARFAALSPTPLERAERLEQLRALEHGHKIAVGHTDARSRGIDTAEDLARANAAP